MRIFLDSSALVKRHIQEEGTSEVIELCRDAAEIAVSVICITEVLSACNRLVREKLITKKQYSLIKNEFLLDIDAATIIDLTSEVIVHSITCLESGTIRSMDALHIGTALVYECDVFVTGDSKQKDIAKKMGLKIIFV